MKNLPSGLSSLKSKVDKFDIGKLETTSGHLSKLSNVAKMMLLKGLNKIKSIEDKIPAIVNLGTKTILNAKINEVKDKIPNITNLSSTTALTALKYNYYSNKTFTTLKWIKNTTNIWFKSFYWSNLL